MSSQFLGQSASSRLALTKENPVAPGVFGEITERDEGPTNTREPATAFLITLVKFQAEIGVV